MCSISELAWASSSGSVLMRIVGFGSSDAACLSSAKAARAPTHRFKTGLVSRSIGGGISGRSLCGTSGRHAGRLDVLPKAGFCDMS
jgi:predicted benzoate:H+ symporter BenE